MKRGREDVISLELNVSKLYGAGPGWLPDGESLLISATENARPDTFLCRVDLKTGAKEEVAREVGAGFKESRDGRSVYYQKENSTQLVRLDLQTKRETVIV